MYRIILSIITILCIITGGHLMSIPVFGTKRYHRTPSISGASSVPSSSSNIPYYNQLSTYYDNQPMSSSLSIPYGNGNNGGSLSSIPISTNLNSINNNNYNQQQNGYLTENGYYYYPRHEYHSYGMPTYHGEYKPTPYYYAPAPHYSYYDDRDIISNPMDDLHEEILHEDERERQRELQPIPQLPQSYGQENWYQTHNNNNNNRQQQDELTNNFLKNLIEYNRQIDAQQKLQQQQQDELMQRDQEHKLQLQQYQQQYQQQNQQQPFNNDEYDEYVELDDYEYEPQASENIYDMKKYERLDNSQPNYQQQHQQQQENVYNPLHQQKQLKSISSKQYDNDDEDVRQLKSLAHHSNNVQNLKTTSSKSPKSHHKTYKIKDFDDSSIEEDIIDTSDNFNHYLSPSSSNNNNNNNWNQLQKEQPIQSQVKSYAQYDNEPEEYDDDAWISWDRKRSPLEPIQNKWHKSLKKIESIKAFNNRKQPIIVKVKDFIESPSSTPKYNQIPSETSTKVSTATTSTIKNNQVMSTTNIIPTKNNGKSLKTSGQKEIVIPRPAVNNPQTNMFTSGFGIFNTNKNIHQSKQFDPINLVVKQDDDDDDDSVKENILLKKKNNLKDDDQKRSGKENVYDTIKQLLAMEQQLEKTPLASKVQKRFVTNEESLVNELNNLKRSST